MARAPIIPSATLPLSVSATSPLSALIVIGKDRISAELEKAGLRAAKRTEKELSVDSGDLQTQLTAAAQQTTDTD